MQTKLRVLTLLATGFLFDGTAKAQDTQAPNAPHEQRAPQSEIKRAIRWKAFEYTCGGGEKVSVYLSSTLAKVLFQGQQYLMKQTISADGNRYSDGKVLWWGKGEGGFLQEDTPDGVGKFLAKDCKLERPAEAQTSAVTGTVAYPQKMALPPNAVVEVRLQDVSQANLPPKTVAEQRITLGKLQLPLLFEVRFDPAKIDQRHSYMISADVLVDNEVRFTNEKTYPVLTLGHSSHVDVILRQPNEGNNP